MSRRPDPNKTAQNQQTLKTLVKLEGNKTCADCKRNKHPRWASWNLGVFICIRCSGIHRGMGTHISRVKSVDLDAWTDEQLASVLKWGNTRANKYWEAKLAAGHVPAEAKIENFIRTKYDSKRWVMDGPMPDPSTLDAEGDDDVPLNVVQEKAKLERSASLRTSSVPAQAPGQQTIRKPAPSVDLFGDPIPAPSAAAPPRQQPAAASAAAPASRASRGGESLLGFDFFGGSQSAPPSRPTSTTPSASSGPSRPDLKQSILSLYASAPRPAQQQQAARADAAGAQPTPAKGPASNGLEDMFGSLDFNTTSAQPPPQNKSSPFSNLASPPAFSSPRVSSPPNNVISPKPAGVGSFFDPKPPTSVPQTTTAPLPPQTQTQRPSVMPTLSSSSGFGDWASATSPPPISATKQSGGGGLSSDLFDFSADPVSPPAAKAPAAAPMSAFDSPFNLSAQSKPKQNIATPTTTSLPPSKPAPSSFMADDPWGSSTAWASSHAPAAPAVTTLNTQAPAPVKATPAPAAVSMNSADDWGSWNDAPKTSASQPKVTADEDFGGWESSTTATVAAAPTPKREQPPSKPAGALSDQDLFSNVWE